MIIAGVDEVGRGCWAGPLFACVAIINSEKNGKNNWFLRDSKTIPKHKRQLANDLAIKECIEYSLGSVSAAEIDTLGLTKATSLAMTRAIMKIKSQYDELIVDGNINYLKEYVNSKCLIKADSLVPAVSAASIIAKVARDNYMIKLDNNYPYYNFKNNVGYGTKEHIESLQKYGPCPEHRKSYKPIKLLLNRSSYTSV